LLKKIQQKLDKLDKTESKLTSDLVLDNWLKKYFNKHQMSLIFISLRFHNMVSWFWFGSSIGGDIRDKLVNSSIEIQIAI
jgi:hypothetical protein